MLATLSDREAGIVRLRFGLTDGEIYGITRERIWQIESKTMAKLRHASRSEALRDHLD